MCLLVLAAGVLVAVLCGVLTTPPRGGAVTTLQIVSIACAVFGGVGAAALEPDVRARARLDRGEGVIARWRVDLATWRAFVDLDRRLEVERGPALRNRLALRRPPAGADVAVTVTADSVDVDGDLHAVRKGTVRFLGVTRLAGPPTCLEFALCYPATTDGVDVYRALRFPIGSGAEGESAARLVEAHYAATTPR